VERLAAALTTSDGQLDPLLPVRRLMVELETSSSNSATATELNLALEKLSGEPSQAVFELLRELVENEALAGARDDRGRRCRAVALKAWLDLGYPWALQLTPDALDEIRSLEPRSARGWLGFTLVAALVSGVFYGGIVVLSLEVMSWAVTLPFGLMFFHAVATGLIAALRQARAAKAKRLRVAGRLGWVAPLAIGAATLWIPEAFFGGLILFAPFFLTAMFALVASSRVAMESSEP